VLRVTNFAVRPLRRVIPGFFGLDWASLIPFYIAELLSVLGSHCCWITRSRWRVFPYCPPFCCWPWPAALRLALYLLLGLILLQAILSWVNPFSPHAPLFYALSHPLLKPFQKLIPPIGGVDITPVVALIVVQLLLIAPVSALERLARTMVW